MSEAKSIPIDNVMLEKRIELSDGSYITPDVVVETFGRQLIIEVKVTHAVDETKIGKLIDEGLSAIEIDLSGFRLSVLEEVERAVLTTVSQKKWLYNHKGALLGFNVEPLQKRKVRLFQCKMQTYPSYAGSYKVL